MSYLINDIFYTLQGEGYWTGRAATFLRFARCNLWTGREEDRHRAVCQFCDTDFLHGDRYSLDELIYTLHSVSVHREMIVLTGGEPSLQIDRELLDALHAIGYYVAIETNGTRTLPEGIDWVCVSPKAGTQLATKHGNELKVVYPQAVAPSIYEDLDFDHFWLSPMDGPNLIENTRDATDFVLRNPKWRLNIQTHKVIGVK